jgi:hypothetical protein
VGRARLLPSPEELRARWERLLREGRGEAWFEANRWWLANQWEEPQALGEADDARRVETPRAAAQEVLEAMPEALRAEPREQRRARGRADGRGRVGVREEGPVARERVELGRAEVGAPVAPRSPQPMPSQEVPRALRSVLRPGAQSLRTGILSARAAASRRAS